MPGWIDRLGIVVLAAGASRRFGADDKLLAPLGGRPLAAHAFALAGAAARDLGVPSDRAVAVTARPEAAALARQAGLASVPVPPGGLQSDSVRSGLAALPPDVAAVLFLLADMPWLEASDIGALLRMGPPACSQTGAARMPPALLPREWCAATPLSGDQGLRPLLARVPAARCVSIPAARLADVDRPEDLRAP